MVLPVIAFYILFHYAPMYGAIIAFKNYEPHFGIIGSPWVGLKHFFDFFRSPYFARVIKYAYHQQASLCLVFRRLLYLPFS